MRVSFRRGRPSPAMAVAFVALLAALSGTAVALPGTKTVDSGDLKRGAVKSSNIAQGAVTGAKLRNGAVTSAKLRNGAVTGSKIRTGTITGSNIGSGTILGSNIGNGTLTGAKLANDTVTGAQVNESTLGTVPRAEHANTSTSATNANTVGGHAANSLVRVASAGSGTPVLVGVDGTALTTPIDAPSAGFLVINAGSDVSNVPPADIVNCFIAVDGAQSPPSARTIELSAENTQENCTTETVVQVAAGNHVVNFEYTGLDTGTTVGASSLQVLFVPFGGTGALP
jgi:hypothetical protein